MTQRVYTYRIATVGIVTAGVLFAALLGSPVAYFLWLIWRSQ